MQTLHQNKHQGIWIYLILLTSFFLLLEISFFIQCNRAYLSDYTFVSDNLHIPLTIIPGVLFFLAAQMFIHIMYCFIVWIVVQLSAPVLPFMDARKFYYAAGVWFLGLLTILTANQYYFPNSKFAELTSLVLINQQVTMAALVALAGLCAIIGLLAVAGLVKRIIRHSLFYLPLLIALGATSGFTFFKSASHPIINAASAVRPNIILIGIDSLRPDFLGYFGSERPVPFLDSYLERATVFSEAVTPLARTFPSWASILTGQYPVQTRIRSNLAQQNGLQLENTLPSILQRNGYETIYATDETRFSNIDRNFGFDRIITPPMGLNDFLIGNFNDFPLSNLIVNTSLGKWLFPHSYGNRPVYFLYDPDSFLRSIKETLSVRHDAKPLFLAMHFCLPHYPYLWSGLPGKDYTPQERYVESIRRVDSQIRDLFSLLKQFQLLDHAIVVLLSDHGEALEFPGDRITEADLYLSSRGAGGPVPRFYPPSLDKEDVNQSAGHGTDVLGLPQYHTLLVFRMYGMKAYKPGVISGVVSLLDIKPTLLDFLNIPSPDSSGITLASAIKDPALSLPDRHIFMESDFSPEAIRTVYPETRKVLLEGIDLFQIDPVTTRLTVRNEMAVKIISSKQYADIYRGWMLALYPQSKHFRMPILINLNTGQWTNDLQASFARHSPADLMLAELKKFYGQEINKVISVE
ncbi:hypothetical protein AQUSIP_11860 [Aquicella siphonis]|uniref:Sulfatase N-terminal domain-containing protein n=1 Tax=Aquicella siphonis TaxID=254247 RepID=A0A5E4PH19_9COXI|nr:sulfatase-like hydrolase/transferase [Aquicella siphonis]VVC75885.1 hypothetical protein AQUSIP_11860 [Aquicella siphonis]